MNYILFDTPADWVNLNPVTLTRPISDIRCGILKIYEKWEKYLNSSCSFLSTPYLQQKFKTVYAADNIYINAAVLPDEAFVISILNLKLGQKLFSDNILLAYRTTENLSFGFEPEHDSEPLTFQGQVRKLKQLPDLFLNNANEIKKDFELITSKLKSKTILDPHVVQYKPENLYVAPTAKLKACILNAENGPIYIGENADVQEGSILIGPVAICNDSMVAFGARLRPNTTLGPFSRVGGEVGNSIFQAYSNKAHDGFLGNSFIGEWCNLGANTNNSNLKNDYKTVKLYNYAAQALKETGELFCGTFMGDYTKAGISTMFNTGTVLGVSVNVFGAGFQEKYVPSFTWGGKAEGYEPYRFEKAISVIQATMERKNLALSEFDYEILKHLAS
jgi:UDP-N-acetylglucosamine diphosphorylase / glucose-1-phosphate thymidylyltransferase / UDP-N-acetylgalactosamine diphosphorylase / glucosamine-1-phosphate N-acetyltransferase / galactosamine-1-phosphate N-acetyltransferase